jgi:ABC-type uncharacterized transport system permease subunit
MKGHPVAGVIFGFLFGLFLAGFLLTIGVLATDSILHLVLPVGFLFIGLALAAIAPFKRSRLATAGAGPAPLADTPPPAAEEPPAGS